MSRQPTQKDKTQRAFAAHLELLDAADWLRKEIGGPLDYAGLTVNEFRLLLMLYEEGSMTISAAANRRSCNRQNFGVLLSRLAGCGSIRLQRANLPPVPVDETQLPKIKRGKPRRGYRVVIVSLTGEGKRLIEGVIPKHAKLVKALMRVLDMREQVTLAQLCRKLREGDREKVLREMQMEDAEEDLRVVRQRARRGLRPELRPTQSIRR